MSKRNLCRYECGRPVEKDGLSRCRTCRRADKKRGAAKVRSGGPRILFIDIETAPALSYHFGRFNVNIGLEATVEPERMLCFAAKWAGEDEVIFFSEWRQGRRSMIWKAWELMDQADWIVHYYGSRFDVPWLNRCFAEEEMWEPSPFKQVDLKNAVSKKFKLDSNKLQFVSETFLGLGGKVQHEGMRLWVGCLQGDSGAQGRMEEYNRRDTEMLEDVYERLLPWLPSHPDRNLYGGTGGCPRCGKDSIEPAGTYRTAQSLYPLYRCHACGSQLRGTKRLGGVSITSAVVS